jgi:uncharacterized protein YcfJ
MNKLTIAKSSLIGLAISAMSLPAFAGHRNNDEDRYDDGVRYNDGVVYAPVVRTQPNYREVRVSEPRQECRNERVVYRDSNRGDSNIAGAILGGIIGGVAGHQIGGGHGRDVATGIGAILGAGIGANTGRGYGGNTERVNYEQRCETYNDYHYENRVEDYDVTYRYNGRLYNTSLPYDPGRRIAIQVNVQPVR